MSIDVGANCCCHGAMMSGIGSSTFVDELAKLEEQLAEVGARTDVHLAFVLKWETATDIDGWLIQPDGVAIGYSSPYKGKVNGDITYNYVLEERVVTLDQNSPHLTNMLGNLDKDSIRDNPAIENIVFFDETKMADGKYQYKIDDFSGDHNRGFVVYIILRHPNLRVNGWAKLVWSGTFEAPRMTKNAPTFIELTKTGLDYQFKKLNPSLQIVENHNLNWS